VLQALLVINKIHKAFRIFLTGGRFFPPVNLVVFSILWRTGLRGEGLKDNYISVTISEYVVLLTGNIAKIGKIEATLHFFLLKWALG